jgi:hypothetical protein
MHDMSVDSRFIRSRAVELQLRDSTPAVIRPIVSEDRDRLRQGLKVPLPLPTEKLVDSTVYVVLRAAARGELQV